MSTSRVRGRLGEPAESGILDERVLVLVFESMQWDIHTLCRAASVNRRLRGLVNRVLWRELCLRRANRMMSALTEGNPNARISGGWASMAKLLFFCGGGGSSTRHFRVSRPVPGHFVESTRFSKTSGRSFLARSCREDVLYVTDPCEHTSTEAEEQLGIYRGVFQSFTTSRTRERLIRRRAELEASIRCPYCGSRVWSMSAARLMSGRSAARRLGSSGADSVEYFVCVNGHLHGMCWLLPLSSDEGTDGSD